jgi:hypothetical protein
MAFEQKDYIPKIKEYADMELIGDNDFIQLIDTPLIDSKELESVLTPVARHIGSGPWLDAIVLLHGGSDE